jgi:hypothetical protein
VLKIAVDTAEKPFCFRKKRLFNNVKLRNFFILSHNMFVRIPVMMMITIATLSRSTVQRSIPNLQVISTTELNQDLVNSVIIRRRRRRATSQGAGGDLNENSMVDDENENEQYVRTATGGFIYTLMVLLTILAYIGNATFLIYVFWLSR